MQQQVNKIEQKNSIEKKFWWKEAVFYNIWIKSFKDGNGDGEGDLYGILDKMDHLQELGVDAVWITPFYNSPLIDEGYDISDYKNVLEKYGTMDVVEQLIEGLKQRNIKVLLDLVPNHCSNKHEWFQKALQGDAKYKDYFIWKKAPNDKKYPNNWQSIFGGSVWTKQDPSSDEFYFHMFAKEQPDLNWHCKDLRQDYKDIINFWNQKGISGYKIDALSHISKPKGLPDYKVVDEAEFHLGQMHTNGPDMKFFISELNDAITHTDGQKNENVVLAEMAGMQPKEMDELNNPENNLLHMHLCLDHLTKNYVIQNDTFKYNEPKPFSLKEFKNVLIQNYNNTINGWNSVYFINHDYIRPISKFSNGKIIGDNLALRVPMGRMICIMLLTLQGSPIIFQGEEIGMTNPMLQYEDFKDVEVLNYYRILVEEKKIYTKDQYLKIVNQIGRDLSRTPMQWSDDQYSGFSTNEPWFKICENYKQINVKKEKDINNKNSIFQFYQKLIKKRKELINEIVYGTIEFFMEDSDELFVYKRQQKNQKSYLLIILSFKDYKIDFQKILNQLQLNKKNLNMIIGNYDDQQIENKKHLEPYEGMMIRIDQQNFKQQKLYQLNADVFFYFFLLKNPLTDILVFFFFYFSFLSNQLSNFFTFFLYIIAILVQQTKSFVLSLSELFK